MRTAAITAAVFLMACAAMGSTITSLNPSTLPYRGGEFFITANGTDLGDRFVFDGPAGHFELDANAVDATRAVSWVPAEVMNDPGVYALKVTGRLGDSNTVNFTVYKPGRPLLALHIPELLLAVASSRLGTTIKYEVSATGGEGTVTTNCEPDSGSTFPYGTSSIRCIATDLAGNRADGVINVNVWDGTAPVLELPKSFEVPAETEEGAFVKFDTRAFDEIDGELLPTCLPQSGSLFRPGRTRVDCEAVDIALNPVYGSFEVMVQPRDPGFLQLKVPEKVVEAATSKYGADVSFEVVAFGSADPDPIVECTPPSGAFFPMGLSKVYCTAEDDFGQRAEAGFYVEVVERLGLRMPDVTAEATSPTGTEVTWETVAEGWSEAIACSPDSGSLFDLGATTVECRSTDAKGRRAEGSFTVNVADTIAPHINRIRANSGAVDAERQVVPVQVTVDAIDAADAMPRCSISTLTSEADAAFDWRLRSDLEVEVRAETNRAFRIQVSCVDASGNRSMDSVAVSLPGTGRRRAAGN